jgi:hypothetical protein
MHNIKFLHNFCFEKHFVPVNITELCSKQT